MIISLLNHIETVNHPIQIRSVKNFINLTYRKFKSIFDTLYFKVDYKIIINEMDKDANTLAFNVNSEITFNIHTINRMLSLLDTIKAQETFLTLLVLHEMSHSIVKMEEGCYEDVYESYVNKFAINMLTERSEYNYHDIENSVKRMTYLNNGKSDSEKKVYAAIKSTLLFSIKM